MNTVESLPFSLGIRTNYKGYYYLVDALTLIMEDENRLLSIGTELFPAIALKYQTDVRCIERNIRTVIKVCWESTACQKLQSISPYPLESPPTVGEFLDILFWHLVREKETKNKRKEHQVSKSEPEQRKIYTKGKIKNVHS